MADLSSADVAVYNAATSADARVVSRPVKTKDEKDKDRKIEHRRMAAEDLQANPVFVSLIDGLARLLEEETNKMRKTMPSGLHKQQGIASGVELSLEYIKTKLANTPKPKRSIY